MPQRRSSPAPEVMTWGKALPVLIVAGFFDAMRIFFEWFVFFGPALAAAICSVLVDGKIAAAVCVVAAGAVGFAGAAAIAFFGLIMAEAVGFAGWLVVGGILFLVNIRIFKENILWFVGSLLVSEMPLVGGVVPAMSVAVWRMYSNQIRIEKALYQQWEKENANLLRAEQLEEAAQIQRVQMQNLEEQAELEEQEATGIAAEQEEANAVSEEQRQIDREAEPGRSGARESEEGVESRQASTSAPERATQSAAGNDTQFDTMQDALSELNAKQNRTPEENRLLVRARRIMQTVSIDATETTNPVLRAAYERARQGQKVSDATDGTRNGFVFNNLQMVRSAPAPTKAKEVVNTVPSRRGGPANTAVATYRREEAANDASYQSPNEQDKAA
jgi:hypothetical protein